MRQGERKNRNENVFYGPVDYAKTLKLRLRVGDLDLPERRKRYASSREEEEDAQMCPSGKAVESRTHIVGECEISKEEREIDECDKASTLEQRENDRYNQEIDGGHKTRNRKGTRSAKKEQERDNLKQNVFLCNIWTKRNEHPDVAGVSY